MIRIGSGYEAVWWVRSPRANDMKAGASFCQNLGQDTFALARLQTKPMHAIRGGVRAAQSDEPHLERGDRAVMRGWAVMSNRMLGRACLR